MSENVTIKTCHTYRQEIYSAIFPRWALMSIGGVIVTVLFILYMMNSEASTASADALKKAENNETKFTLEVQYLKDGQSRIERQLSAQQILLMSIDKKIPEKE